MYILHSEKINKFYIGSCQNLALRLKQHKGKEFESSFTSNADDWVLFFSIDNLDGRQARWVETHIKRMKSSIYIKNLKRYPNIVLKLIGKSK